MTTGIIIHETREDKVKILCNQPVRTGRTIPNKISEIIILANKQGVCMLTDIEIPGARNLIMKEAENISNHKDLMMETQCKWNVAVKVIPVINGATGSISKSLRQYLSNIPGKHEI